MSNRDYNLPGTLKVTVKPKIHYDMDELFRRGWSFDEIVLLGEPDSRRREGRINKGKFFYTNLYLIERVEQAEAKWSATRTVDHKIKRIVSASHNDEQRYFAILKDGRRFGGIYNNGFKTKQALSNCHFKTFLDPTITATQSPQ